jgi:alpha-N-acetylglucosaminidase
MGTDLLGHQSENLLCAKPKFGIASTSTWGDATLTHDLGKMVQAARLLFSCHDELHNQATYRSDCVEAFRQLFNDYGVQIYEQLSEAYAARDSAAFAELAEVFLEVLSDCDRVYSCGEYTLFGRWIAAARSKGANQAEKDLLERNARQLVTLWTPEPTDLTDYAYRGWGGLTRDYYLPRWKEFLQRAKDSLGDPAVSLTLDDSAKWAGWVKTTGGNYETRPIADAADTARSLWLKYESRFEAGTAYWRAKAASRRVPGRPSL